MYFMDITFPDAFFLSTNFWDVDVAVTAVKKYTDGLLIGEPSKLWYYMGAQPDTMTPRPVSPVIGITNPEGVIKIEGAK